MKQAGAEGRVWKLVGELCRREGRLCGTVGPVCLPMTHPLARVNGVSNGLLFGTHLLGDVFVQGPGAGRVETGFAIVQDLLAIYS